MRKKVLKSFLTLKKTFFFQDTFLEKMFFLILKKFLSFKNFPNFFLKFFPKKFPEKNCFECQKTFQNFFHITFYLVQKKVTAKLSELKDGQFCVCPEIRIT